MFMDHSSVPTVPSTLQAAHPHPSERLCTADLCVQCGNQGSAPGNGPVAVLSACCSQGSTLRVRGTENQETATWDLPSESS